MFSGQNNENVLEKLPGFVFGCLEKIERTSLKMLPAFPLKSVGWSSSGGRLKLEKTTKIMPG